MFRQKNCPLLTSFILVNTAISAASDVVLKQEPPIGQMREGQRVLVDDGSCPPGQIKEVIGGNYVKVGGTKDIERTRRCIQR